MLSVQPNSTCLQCGTAFVAKPAKPKAGIAKYCSRECWGAARRSKRVELTCRQCGAQFAVVACYAMRGQYTFCSRACYDASRPRTPKPAKPTRDDLFDEKVKRSDSCWDWMGFRQPNGYGQCGSGKRGKHEYAHRRAFERASGEPIPEGMGIYHTCDRPWCVRNDEQGTYEIDGKSFPRWGHLWLGKDADNVGDKVAKERQLRGETAPNHLLTANEVRQIHEFYAAGMTQQALADEFSVSKGCITDIVYGKSWKTLAVNHPRRKPGRKTNLED